MHSQSQADKVVCLWKKCIFPFSSCHCLRLVVFPAVGAHVLSVFQQSIFCCWCWLSHAAPCEAFAGAHSSSSRKETCSALSCSGQYWLFCEAVWVRLSDSPSLFPCMLNHSLIASLFFHCSWQSTCITADNTTLLLSLMSGSTVTCLVFMCSCIVIFYRCIRYLWTKATHQSFSIESSCHIYVCTHMANWYNKCSAIKPTLKMPSNHIMDGGGCFSDAISWLLNDIKAKPINGVFFSTREWVKHFLHRRSTWMLITSHVIRWKKYYSIEMTRQQNGN